MLRTLRIAGCVSKTLCRRIAAYKAELAKAAALLRATTHSFVVKAMMGPHVPESALALMKKADFLSSITGEKVTIQDIAKLSTTVRSAGRGWLKQLMARVVRRQQRVSREQDGGDRATPNVNPHWDLVTSVASLGI